jgi:amino acid adenylation domain-containing protein
MSRTNIRRQTIPKKRSDTHCLLSFTQQRLWLTEQLVPEVSINNVIRTLYLKGNLEETALELALNNIVSRHETLRTTFSVQDGEAVQNILPCISLALTMIDLTTTPSDQKNQELIHIAQNEARNSFDLSCDPLIRAILVRLSEQEHVLMLTLHHIISDGWSMGVFSRELEAFYRSIVRSETIQLPELPIQYSDYVKWQRNRLRDEAISPLLDYWKQQLSGCTRLELPTDRSPTKLPDYRVRRSSLTLPVELTNKIKRLGQEENCTLFMTLLACFNIVLHRYTGETDIVIGIPISGRHGLDETNDLIGFFVNTLVLRTDLSNNPSFRQLLDQVRNMALQAYKHSALPFDKLVEMLRPDRRHGGNPLFDIMINFHESSWHKFRLDGLNVEEKRLAEPLSDTALSLDLLLDNEFLQLNLNYQTALFDEWRIDYMLGHLKTLLEGCVANPDQNIAHLPLLTENERRQILKEWNNTAKQYPSNKTIHALFEAQALTTPDVPAVIFENQQLSYGELNTRANQLAHYLAAQGIGPDVVVGISLERSPEMIIGLLAILKAGGAYLPLDPVYPTERLSFMMQDAGIKLLLTRSSLLTLLPANQARPILVDSDWALIARHQDRNPLKSTGPDNLAYLIYTSGSSGKPKGVPIHHQALVNYITGTADFFGIGSDDRVLQFSTISFDTAAEEIFSTLTRGATLILRTDAMLASIATFLDHCRSLAISKLILPTAFWHEIAAQMAEENLPWPEKIKLVVIGGEQASNEKLAAWLRHVPKDVALINAYGPTETTIATTMGYLHRPNQNIACSRITIGNPVQNSQVYILDQNLEPMPVGIPGELCIGGIGLSRGYLNRPDLTAERFVADPFSDNSNARLYRTGDRTRYLPDSNIEYLGRGDHQVKLRGFRIELGEIEAIFQRQAGVHDAVVIVREDQQNSPYLAAYVIPGDIPPSTHTLQNALKDKLPSYMVPNVYIMLDTWPLTPSGKFNYKALPAPEPNRSSLCNELTTPHTPYEKQIARIWVEVMALENPGLHDSFFELGGHSLLATRVIARINRTFDTQLLLRNLFESPTIAGLAQALLIDKTRTLQEATLTALLDRLESLTDPEAEQLLANKAAEKP